MPTAVLRFPRPQKLEANSPETLLALVYYQYWALSVYHTNLGAVKAAGVAIAARIVT